MYSSLNLETIMHNKQAVQEAINEHYPLAILICMMLIMGTVIFSLPITFCLRLRQDLFLVFFRQFFYQYCYRSWSGLCMFGSSVPITGLLEKRYSKVMARFDNNFSKQGLFYLLCMLLLPITPFGVITLTAGLSNISVLRFSGIVALGVLPSTVMYAFAGTQLAHVNSQSDILSWRMVIALVVLAALALIPVVVQKYKAVSHRD